MVENRQKENVLDRSRTTKQDTDSSSARGENLFLYNTIIISLCPACVGEHTVVCLRRFMLRRCCGRVPVAVMPSSLVRQASMHRGLRQPDRASRK